MKPYETHGHYADSIDGFEEAQMLASIKVSTVGCEIFALVSKTNICTVSEIS